ncbi:hypothetical protein ACJX0J_041943, partial [Zea mays]
DESDGGGDGVQELPVYVAGVDLACSEEFLELIKSALLAALDACWRTVRALYTDVGTSSFRKLQQKVLGNNLLQH